MFPGSHSPAEDELPREAWRKKLKGEGEGPEEPPVGGAETSLPGGESPGGSNDVIGSEGGSFGDGSSDVIDSKGEAPDNEANSSGSSSVESEDGDDTSSTDIEDELMLGKDLAQEVGVAWG